MQRHVKDVVSATSLVFTSAVQFCGCTEPPAMSVSLTPFESKSGTFFKGGDLSCPTLYVLSHIMEMSELSCLKDMLQKVVFSTPHSTSQDR